MQLSISLTILLHNAPPFYFWSPIHTNHFHTLHAVPRPQSSFVTGPPPLPVQWPTQPCLHWPHAVRTTDGRTKPNHRRSAISPTNGHLLMTIKLSRCGEFGDLLVCDHGTKSSPSKQILGNYRYRQSMMEKGSMDINACRQVEICKLIVGLSDKCNINI